MSVEPWLTILGIGDNGLLSLNATARALFDKADHVVAPERVLDVLPEDALADKQVTPWTSRVHETIRALHEKRGEPVTILATGDPYHFGIAATLSRTIPPEEMFVIPHPSGFSLAAAKLGWALADVDCISLHGRKVSRLHPFIEPNNRVLALTSNAETIKAASEILVSRGFASSLLTILEHVGGEKERIVQLRADEAQDADFADFNMLAISCVAGEGAKIYPRLAGLPDSAFSHDGQLTKREVRAVTLAALSPYPNALLWDVGAGCGSVAIEWMRSARGAQALAFEKDQKRLSMMFENATALGVPGLEVVEGSAPKCLYDQKMPDAVFIGGGLTSPGLFETCWESLRSGGKLVANTVTLEGEAKLIALREEFGGDLVRMDVSHLTDVGRMHALQPRMSILQWRAEKQS